MRNCDISIIFLFIIIITTPLINVNATENKGRTLAQKVVDRSGGIENLYERNDVEYVYIVRGPEGKVDISLERYIFDGELSWGKYVVHENFLPEIDSAVKQGYNGSDTWCTTGGKPCDEEAREKADFLRKTNYYWFTMMFKLTDPGTNHEYTGTKKINGTEYETVRLTFDEGTGDVQDTYVLFINPDTMLVDRFLFTVMDYGVSDPLLMEVKYESFDNLMLPVYRRFTKADWNGKPVSDKWTEEIYINPEFNNGFSGELFENP